MTLRHIQAFNKLAGARKQVGAGLLSNIGVSTLTGLPAPLVTTPIGVTRGLLQDQPSAQDILEMDQRIGKAFIPTQAAKNQFMRARYSTGSKAKALAPDIGVALQTVIGGLIGAAVGGATGTGKGKGALYGALAAAAINGLGSLYGFFKPGQRTPEQQRRANRRSVLYNLIPGYAGYNVVQNSRAASAMAREDLQRRGRGA